MGVAITPTALTFGADEPPPIVSIAGVVRDFREWGVEGGHPDFEQMPPTGFGRYAGNLAGTLSANRKPIFTGAGGKIAQEWRDVAHRPICRSLYDLALGDTEGHFSQPGTGGITSAETFGQWFNDALGVNLPTMVTLNLILQPDGSYVFDDDEDPYYSELGGFFPIDDQLYGNSEGSDHNYHFTFELHADLTYDAGDGQFFKFIGDDNVFVFVDGQLVIDLGGVHASHDQYLDLDRLGLEEDQTYPLDFFFAQRHQPHSSFRIETNLVLQGTQPTTISGLFD